MRDNKRTLTMSTVLVWITTSVLATPLAIGLGQSEPITRPAVSEESFPT